MERLSIIIQTYNRRARLLNTLRLLEKQNEKSFNVIISDNCSNYSVDDILSELSDEISSRIILTRNAANLGMVGNIVTCFNKINSKWCWLLADDDQPEENAVQTILQDINEAERINAGVIQYPHFDFSKDIFKEKIVVEELRDYVDYCNNLLNKGVSLTNIQGSNIWLSNKVFCKERIKRYIQFAYRYANTGIPQTIPIIKMLEEKKYKLLIHNKVIVHYPEIGNFEKTWNEVDIALGLSTLSYIPLDIDYEVKVGIWYFLMLRYKCVLHKYKEMGKSNYLFLKSVYENIYKFILKDEEKKFFELLIELAKEDSDIDFLKNWDGR